MAERPSAALSNMEDQVKCPICLHHYTNPRLLTCFHVYCEGCLHQMVSADHDKQEKLSVTCPKCQSFTHLPPIGVSGLQVAFRINHLLEIQKMLEKIEEPQKLACEKCTVTTRPATSFCRQCAKFVCEACSSMHKEWEELKDHEVVSLEEVEEGLVSLDSPNKVTHHCTKHDEHLQLFCETCGELICNHCTVHAHKDHKYCVIAETIESHKDEILASLEPVEKQLEAINRALVRINGRCEEIAIGRATIEAEINAAFDEVCRALDTREAKLMAQLENHTQQQLKRLSIQREEVEILQAHCERCVQFVRESLHDCSPEHVIKMKPGVVKQVRELVDTFDPHTLEPRQQTSINFIPSPQLVNDCEEFGGLHCTKLPRVSNIDRSKFGLLFPTKLEPQAKFISRLTDQTTKCLVTERGKKEYEISYQPAVRGAHQLHIRVGGEEVRGSPFQVTVRTSAEQGTVIKTIDGVNRPHGMAVNKSGEVIVAEERNACVSVFSSAGDKLRVLDTEGTVVGRMKNPSGVAVDSEDNILVADAGNHRLVKFSQLGDLIGTVGSEGNDPGQFHYPTGICYNIGNVYVADQNAHRVHILNSDLPFSSELGSAGERPKSPYDTASNSIGCEYVIDYCYDRVQVCNSNQTFSSMFGSKGKGDGQFDHPIDVASDSTGCVYVADCLNHRVQVFTPEGSYLRQFGKRGSGNGELCLPTCICVDSDDLVYVGEEGNNRISVFTNEGEFLKWFGSKGSMPGQFDKPCGLVVTGEVVYICDKKNNRVQVI